MKKKITTIISLILLSLLITSNVFAATVSSKNVKLEVVEDNVCTINILEHATFEKKLIDVDLENKEVTIGLKITNNAVAPLDEPSEIVLLMDNSLSMRETISTGGTRMNAVSNSAKTLANALLEYPTVKVSVVSFSTVDNGNKVPGDTGYVQEGTLSDAKLRTALTQNKETVLSAIDSVANDTTGVRTDIEAGLTVANAQFSGTIDNKYIILLTDGVPNISLGSNRILYSGQTATNTKNALINISNSGVKIFSMMTGVTEDTNAQTGQTYKELAEEVFGTPENPTVGKFYYITDSQIEDTISNIILNDIKAPDDGVLTDINIYDYFPQDIVDNFDFSYVQEPSKGTASRDIDLQNNCIVWNIDSLGYGESATLSYKLTLKDNINPEIISVILNTNSKVDITTEKIKDNNGDLQVFTSDVSPKIRLVENSVPTPTPTPTPKDDTVAPTPIPQTGVLITIYIVTGIVLIGAITLGVRAFIKNKKLK